MGIFNKLKEFILPKEIDFFGNLVSQCQITEKIVASLTKIYCEQSSDTEELILMIHEAKELRLNNLTELNNALITPIDKEAIGRIYINLHWIGLSVKHLTVEINACQITHLKRYEALFSLLEKQMNTMTNALQLLQKKKYDEVSKKLYEIIHLDNLVIQEYSNQLVTLFKGNDFKEILQQKEIVTQIKEISKRVHFCTNSIEDVVLKMN